MGSGSSCPHDFLFLAGLEWTTIASCVEDWVVENCAQVCSGADGVGEADEAARCTSSIFRYLSDMVLWLGRCCKKCCVVECVGQSWIMNRWSARDSRQP